MFLHAVVMLRPISTDSCNMSPLVSVPLILPNNERSRKLRVSSSAIPTLECLLNHVLVALGIRLEIYTPLISRSICCKVFPFHLDHSLQQKQKQLNQILQYVI